MATATDSHDESNSNRLTNAVRTATIRTGSTLKNGVGFLGGCVWQYGVLLALLIPSYIGAKIVGLTFRGLATPFLMLGKGAWGIATGSNPRTLSGAVRHLVAPLVAIVLAGVMLYAAGKAMDYAATWLLGYILDDDDGGIAPDDSDDPDNSDDGTGNEVIAVDIDARDGVDASEPR